MRFVRLSLLVGVATWLSPSFSVAKDVSAADAQKFDAAASLADLLTLPFEHGTFQTDLKYAANGPSDQTADTLKFLREGQILFQTLGSPHALEARSTTAVNLKLPSPNFIGLETSAKASSVLMLGGLGKVSSGESLTGLDSGSAEQFRTAPTIENVLAGNSYRGIRGDMPSRPSALSPLDGVDLHATQSNASLALTATSATTVASSTEPKNSGTAPRNGLSTTELSLSPTLKNSAAKIVAAAIVNSPFSADVSLTAALLSNDTRNVIIGSGYVLSPGGPFVISKTSFDSTVTLASGGVFQMTVGGTTNGGITSDALVVTDGSLKIGANAAAPFTISLYSIGFSSGTGGPVYGFDPTRNYSWQFAIAPRIGDFSSTAFSFDTSHFLNSTGNGTFFVSQSGNTLSINFTPVPEPSTETLLAIGFGVVGMLQIRKRRR